MATVLAWPLVDDDAGEPLHGEGDAQVQQVVQPT
jgi:hypothetical protein